MFWFCLRSVHLHLQQILSQKLSTHQSVSFCLVSLFLFVIYNPFLAIYFLSSFLSGFINSSLFIVTLDTHPCAHTHTSCLSLSFCTTTFCPINSQRAYFPVHPVVSRCLASTRTAPGTGPFRSGWQQSTSGLPDTSRPAVVVRLS